ncbi:glycosyltransferase [Priestia aryabhattai]|uniref:hypothetical protein n=1 Tax=Priestia aryabhattai TaxID=412384 RepID=UPI0023791BBA|nr:hypothetical protein [Priestia aryabhattai]WDL88470.1 glycosyltransferase [Priestia aryabhattai]
MERYSEIAIVVVAYNRPKSLERLLSSLKKADYLEDHVNLIISIDKGENKGVIEVAENFKWEFGEKNVIIQAEKLGLRRHIICCGELTKQFNNIILLEDDLYLSDQYYKFSKKALGFYYNEKSIAGISLYAHSYNETARLPFAPLKGEHDVYFMQLPSSWGQLWTRQQWESFMNWYEGNNEKSLEDSFRFPRNINNWPETSWKKYFTKYMIEKNKFFVYPYDAYSTNFGDVGTHFWKNNTSFQVSLSKSKREIELCKLEESKSVYDAFCENMVLKKYFKKEGIDECTIDLYGTKSVQGNYILTTKNLKYKLIQSYGLNLKPMEENIYANIEGDNIYLYDIRQVDNVNKKEKKSLHHQYEYFYPGLDIVKAARLLFNLFTLKTVYMVIKKKFLRIK